MFCFFDVCFLLTTFFYAYTLLIYAPITETVASILRTHKRQRKSKSTMQQTSSLPRGRRWGEIQQSVGLQRVPTTVSGVELGKTGLGQQELAIVANCVTVCVKVF